MLNIFKSDRLGKAYKAIEAGDHEKLLKQLQKIDSAELNEPVSDSTPALMECGIVAQDAKAVKLLISFGASIKQTSQTQPSLNLLQLALTQNKSLALLGALLTAPERPELQPLMAECFEQCSEQELMLHLSLLLQHGTQLDDLLMHKALHSQQQPLVHFMINSGAQKPANLEAQAHTPEILAYANKCWEDKKIREMFLQ